MLQFILFLIFLNFTIAQFKKSIESCINRFKSYFEFLLNYYEYLSDNILNNDNIGLEGENIIICIPMPMMYFGKIHIIAEIEENIKELRRNYEKIKWISFFDDELKDYFKYFESEIERIESEIRIYKWKNSIK